jgi:hypothetical protein
MKRYRRCFGLVCIALLTGAPALHAANTDPVEAIYRLSGVRDSGGGMNAGRATSFHRSNFSSVTERLVMVRFNPGAGAQE